MASRIPFGRKNHLKDLTKDQEDLQLCPSSQSTCFVVYIMRDNHAQMLGVWSDVGSEGTLKSQTQEQSKTMRECSHYHVGIP